MLGRDEFTEIMCPLFAYVHPKDRERIDDFLVELYFQGLRDIAPGHLKDAISRHLLTAPDHWLPSIGKIRELCNQCRDGRRWQWSEAWGIILQAVEVWSQTDRERASRARQMVGDLYPFIAALGGFYNLANCDSRTLSVYQSNFRSAYERAEHDRAEQQKLPTHMQQLPQPVIEAAKALGLPEAKGDTKS